MRQTFSLDRLNLDRCSPASRSPGCFFAPLPWRCIRNDLFKKTRGVFSDERAAAVKNRPALRGIICVEWAEFAAAQLCRYFPTIEDFSNRRAAFIHCQPIEVQVFMAQTIASNRRVLLHLDHVGKTYQMGEVSVEVLKQIDLQIFRGELLVMVGPSGSGKTTMLNLIGGPRYAVRRASVVPRARYFGCQSARVDEVSARDDRVRVSVLQSGAESDSARKRDGQHGDQFLADERRRSAAAGGIGRTGRPFSGAAFRRRATAGGDRAGAGQESGAIALR